jgi:allophanate hydrolase
LVRVGQELGRAYDVEVWDVPLNHLGRFLVQVPTPLCVGTVQLSDGTTELGFLCESIAVEGARDVSHLAGWREYMEGQR